MKLMSHPLLSRIFVLASKSKDERTRYLALAASIKMVDTNLSEAKASGNLKRKQGSIELVKSLIKAL